MPGTLESPPPPRGHSPQGEPAHAAYRVADKEKGFGMKFIAVIIQPSALDTVRLELVQAGAPD
ncbi:hypothetical protein [Cutibacterium modestum]|uniref:Uncharacterized protein n=1 Tax=Cutibacterium modestum TaxID=2559073 RepID=A0AAD1KNN0_9ACTN|nr:hypothetical protein [Cutibacterium modestum]EGG27786.1 hypothetical protein PA08_0013 [Cutibacterium modestum P08]BCY24281.1 hypothetical protein KB1_02710 [Cutibacterium modestum]